MPACYLPWWLLLGLSCVSADFPAYYLTEIQSVLTFADGSGLSTLDTRAVYALTQQVKRVIGADPGLDLNVSWIRELDDPTLLRLALQAVLGNMTAGTGPGWQQPCTIVCLPTCLQVYLVCLMLTDTGTRRYSSQRPGSWWRPRASGRSTWRCGCSCWGCARSTSGGGPRTKGNAKNRGETCGS